MDFLNSSHIHPNLSTELKHRVDDKYYLPPMVKGYACAVEEYGLPLAASYLTEVIGAANDEVQALISGRVASGAITDGKQASKSVVGHGFQVLVLTALGSLQAAGMFPKHVICTLSTANHPKIGGSVIHVGPEKIKPDADLLIHSDRSANEPVCLFSLKTSLRERAGQTHRWKVLLDIVTAENCHSLKNKYSLRYDGGSDFRMGLITTNFYNEITKPQQKGLLRFFEHVYLTKPGEWETPIVPFASIAEDLRSIYE